jgi:hypothetical protein
MKHSASPLAYGDLDWPTLRSRLGAAHLVVPVLPFDRELSFRDSEEVRPRASRGRERRREPMSIKQTLRAGAWALALIIGVPLAVSADPIQDLSIKTYAAGWFPNYYRGQGPLTCPRACKAWVEGIAESERATDLVDTAERAYVCKVTTDPAIVQKPINDPASHWIYGSQYDVRPVKVGQPHLFSLRTLCGLSTRGPGCGLNATDRESRRPATGRTGRPRTCARAKRSRPRVSRTWRTCPSPP